MDEQDYQIEEKLVNLLILIHQFRLKHRYDLLRTMVATKLHAGFVSAQQLLTTGEKDVAILTTGHEKMCGTVAVMLTAKANGKIC